VGHFRVRALITGDELRRLAGKPLFVRGGRVDIGLLLRRPVVQRHQLAIGCAVLRGHDRAGLAQPVGAAMGQSGLVTPRPKPIAESGSRKGLAVLGHQIGEVTSRAARDNVD
jgi:hypothetical protein